LKKILDYGEKAKDILWGIVLREKNFGAWMPACGKRLISFS